jgi:hypothetical protein
VRHADVCKIKAVDPGVQIEWSESRGGVWEAMCVCGRDYWYDRVADNRVPLDPLDPKTSRHAPECEFASATEPSVVRVLLRVREGMAPGYWWVECGSCNTAWQVAHYTESVG